MEESNYSFEQPERNIDKPAPGQAPPRYEWSPKSEFPLTGKEFEFTLGAMSAYMSQPKVQEVLAMMQIFEILQEKYNKAIRDGIIYDANNKPQAEEAPEKPSAN